MVILYIQTIEGIVVRIVIIAAAISIDKNSRYIIFKNKKYCMIYKKLKYLF